ncbi:MAG: DNA-binding domain-containing protein [Steroidobacteraceae bacterium]
MLPWADLQEQFAAALRDPQRAPPAGCIGPDGACDTKRFAVYRNNVFAGLIDALAQSYPVVRGLLGAECFEETARRYARQHLPRSPVLLEYGEHFPLFLEQLEPLAALAYLGDVARIERAWLEAYHAPEAPALDPGALARIPAHRAADLCFRLHPSVRLVRSRHAAVTIWRLNVAEDPGAGLPPDAIPESALLARPAAEVEVIGLTPGAAEFLTALAAGRVLGEACERARSVQDTFNLTEHCTALLGGGWVTAAHLKRRRTRGH